MYCLSCSWHQLSCSISLCTLLTESMISKAWAKRLEEDSRDDRNWRCIYSLLDGAAAIAADITKHNISAHNSSALFQMKLIQVYHTKKPATKWEPRDVHVQCHKWSQLLHNHVTSLFTEQGARGYDSVGWESLTGIILVISPHSILAGSLASQSAHSPSCMIYPQRVALTLEAISCNSSKCYDNNSIPIT